MDDIEMTIWEYGLLRNRVATAHQRRYMKAPIVWIEYIDGPLDGLRSAVEAADTTNLHIGWCFNSTRGVVQALVRA
jgi:hypothetical protein